MENTSSQLGHPVPKSYLPSRSTNGMGNSDRRHKLAVVDKLKTLITDKSPGSELIQARWCKLMAEVSRSGITTADEILGLLYQGSLNPPARADPATYKSLVDQNLNSKDKPRFIDVARILQLASNDSKDELASNSDSFSVTELDRDNATPIRTKRPSSPSVHTPLKKICLAEGPSPAQQLSDTRKEKRKVQQARKLGIRTDALDPCDLYSKPMWLGDILLDLGGPHSSEVQKRLANQSEVQKKLFASTRMEFGWYAKGMLDTIFAYFLKTLNVKKPTDVIDQPDYVSLMEGKEWSALQDATSDTKQLKALLYQCPRLLQISGTHPFFNKNYLKMDVLSKAIDHKLGSDIRSRSWFSLNLLMCGTSTSSQPDPKSDFARQNETSLKRLVQTTRDATLLLQTHVRPARPQRTESNEDVEISGRSAAKDYLYLKITAMGGGMKTSSEAYYHEGIPYILRKIFEMLLGVVLIHEGHACIHEKATHKRGGATVRDQLKHGNPANSHQFKCEDDDEKTKSIDWGTLKQQSIGALVTFLTFGVQGWFGCYKSRTKNTYRDIYSLMTLAHEMTLNGFSIISPQTKPGIHTPWRRLNRFLAETVASIGMGSGGSIDWYKALEVWDSILVEACVANLFLLDVFEEIKLPGHGLGLSNLDCPPTSLNETTKATWAELLDQVHVTWPEYLAKKEALIRSGRPVSGWGFFKEPIASWEVMVSDENLDSGPCGPEEEEDKKMAF
ncbi:hypothetical protein MJO29_002839 [Puccinia striiformis f. sp. tritici]|uniref:Golgi to ER traffic-protein n=1 Tax=Puccinia striiformis f. sp. tritici PST-78 TaxID=1165861 RepID=A0A0L0USY9_9BASI|nr:uncharacterized protein Pst134EA_031319 [Puccinia striiformis f. sp. tritici]KAH9445373.1 hypothetical protein Pst134EA_031319 [Puccinia striiformis f. sp. tritici]KAH9462457.1 hypothetical protein Pst134EB_006352 [Puccinia striiformis f. sp. tritici]KAI7964741.1 hypothetical protein MJO29_002839 [Puccinia striiformis f. sp. tritici]KNE90177.1 hypothetical protein PSTG_16361 [Puccinia striiformis f. sp. tritici PST-78]